MIADGKEERVVREEECITFYSGLYSDDMLVNHKTFCNSQVNGMTGKQ